MSALSPPMGRFARPNLSKTDAGGRGNGLMPRDRGRNRAPFQRRRGTGAEEERHGPFNIKDLDFERTVAHRGTESPLMPALVPPGAGVPCSGQYGANV